MSEVVVLRPQTSLEMECGQKKLAEIASVRGDVAAVAPAPVEDTPVAEAPVEAKPEDAKSEDAPVKIVMPAAPATADTTVEPAGPVPAAKSKKS
jgi:hypothetical protein